jgi:endo-1,4-beta-xylanase
MDIQTFNEAIIPYCKALGLAGATAATVVTQTMAPSSPTPTQPIVNPTSVASIGTITITPLPSSTPTPIVSTTPSSGFGGLLQQAQDLVNPPLVSSIVDEDLQKDNLLLGNWEFMPGIIPDGTGVRVHKTDLSLVNQDGSFSMANPPINFAGSHLTNLTGDFQINADIDLLTASEGTIQLYGEAPKAADEFLIPGKSLEIKIGKANVTLNGQTFAFPSSNIIQLSIARKAKEFIVTVNGKEAGKLSDSNIFANGNLWFGFDSADNDWLLKSISAKSLTGSFDVVDGSILSITNHNPNGIQSKAYLKRPGFLVGAAMAVGPLTTDPSYAQVALDNNNFGSITPENEMKMINLQPKKGEYSFGKADALVSLAKQNGLQVHGHALVFGEANPTWVSQLPVGSSSDKAAIEQIMKDHITKVVTHFGSDVNEWDVINEPVADYDDFNASRGQTYRNHKWYQAMGKDYMIKAFVSAHAANPNAMLFVNEYGLEFEGERWDAFITMMQNLKTQLTQNNIPLEKVGVGFQSHVYEKGDIINPTVLRAHIKQLGILGFKTRISEMDVYNDDGDAVQAKQYADVFNACISEPNCIGWTTWMLSDKYDFFIDDDGSVQYGEDGLYDANMKPRPGVASILKVLQ